MGAVARQARFDRGALCDPGRLNPEACDAGGMTSCDDQDSDSDLAARAAAGDRDAFGRLIARHYDRIFRLAWRWTGKRATAEDVAQDVCVKLATAMRGFRGEASFATWAYRIAYTTASDHLKAGARVHLLAPADMMSLVEAGADTPEEETIGGELWGQVRALPGQQCDAVLLVYGEDMSHAEAAAVMGCTEKTVSWHLHEARKRLKISLAATG